MIFCQSTDFLSFTRKVASVRKLSEDLVISRCQISPFQMARESRRAYAARPDVFPIDAGCEFRQLVGKVSRCAVVEELPGPFDSPQSENFGIRKAFRHEWIGPRGDGFNETYAEELMVGSRYSKIGIVQGAHIVFAAILVSPVVDVVQKLTACLCENIRLFLEALVDNVESESGILCFENSDRSEEVFRILVVLPSRGPEDSHRAGPSLSSRWKNIYARRMNRRFEVYILGCFQRLMIGHGLEKCSQSVEEGVHVKFRVEPDGVGCQSTCEVKSRTIRRGLQCELDLTEDVKSSKNRGSFRRPELQSVSTECTIILSEFLMGH